MNQSFDGSFKIYMEPEYDHHPEMAAVGSGRMGPGDEPYTLDMFSIEVDIVKGDLLNLENMHNRLQESNEDIKIAQDAKMVREIRARFHMDLDNLFKLAKQINRKHDGLVRANAAQRMVPGSGPGSSDDQLRANMISQLDESLQSMMRKFQGLRAQIESEHRQLIEAKYYAITREKATAEAIDNLMATEVPEGPLHLAMQEFGRGPVMDAVVEIQERRDTLREIRRKLMGLHQMLLGIAAPVTAPPPVEGQGGGNRGGGMQSSTSDNLAAPPPIAGTFAPAKAGTGGLNDYERETRRQSYVAIAIALGLIIALVFTVLKIERKIETEPE